MDERVADRQPPAGLEPAGGFKKERIIEDTKTTPLFKRLMQL